MERFWKWLALFAWRRWVKRLPVQKIWPVGVPGHRDPDNPCEFYEPRRQRLDEWGDCDGDGHYLCDDCCRHKDAEMEAF